MVSDESVLQPIMRFYWVPSFMAEGVDQMALDEALLEWLHQTETPALIVRTYQWAQPTLSLGVHQNDRDTLAAYRFYSADKPVALVRRPTGGRAILHGADVSYAMVTNAPGILSLSLDESYCLMMTWVRQALESAGVPLVTSCETDTKQYLRSALCFDTKTPSDLTAPDGTKVAGAAQLRRKYGIMQHGAIFAAPFGVSAETVDQALFKLLSARVPKPFDILDPNRTKALADQWAMMKDRYSTETSQIVMRLSTTAGSHFVPASS